MRPSAPSRLSSTLPAHLCTPLLRPPLYYRLSPFGGYADLRVLKKWVCCKVKSLLPAGTCKDVSATGC